VSEPEELSAHYGAVVRDLVENRVVPLLGAGVNLCDRAPGTPWSRGKDLPSGWELADYLADRFYYPKATAPVELLRVSQYAAVNDGTGLLYDELRKLFVGEYEPTRVHEFFASLPKRVAALREADAPPAHQLIVTTNYDDLLERAFERAGETFDVVWYIADGEARGKFWHRPPNGEPRQIDQPEEYDGLDLEQRPVILQIHGAVDRLQRERDSYVITEDHYIDYLTKTELKQLVPVELVAKLMTSRFLFLGYSMQDWNLRVILHRIWGRSPLTYSSWAIQLNPSKIDQKFWEKRDVEVLDIRLDTYIDELARRLDGS
jgi:SIR2-like domain